MTTNDFIKKLDKQIAEINNQDKPLLFGVRNVMALQSKRIFLDGKNTAGGVIGDYKNPRPLYISEAYRLKTNLPKFPLKGKNGETAFKNGNTHKSGYFENFLEFKKAVGRNRRFSTVDLFLTGTLHRHWANSDTVGKAEARKINEHNYIVAISEQDDKKIERYGRVFNLSLSERKIFLNTVKNQLILALK